MPISSGSQPIVVKPLKYATGFNPSSSALSSDITKLTEAPSDNCEELPAVTEPFSGSKTGFNPAKPSNVVPGLLHSSLSTVTSTSFDSPVSLFVSNIFVFIGTISSVNNPASCAAAVLFWLSKANSSCVSLETLYLLATTSAVIPIGKYIPGDCSANLSLTKLSIFIFIIDIVSAPPAITVS